MVMTMINLLIFKLIVAFYEQMMFEDKGKHLGQKEGGGSFFTQGLRVMIFRSNGTSKIAFVHLYVYIDTNERSQVGRYSY